MKDDGNDNQKPAYQQQCYQGDNKIKYPFESVNVGDEFILVPVGDAAKEIHGVIRANGTGNRIMQLLMQGMDDEEVVNALLKEYDNDRETLMDYVRTVISVLRQNHLIG